jgi:hypothetical protein
LIETNPREFTEVTSTTLFRRGPLTMAPSQLGLFTRSDPARERAFS